MRIALVDSGLGSMSIAAELHRLDPESELVLAMDPDHMPWGLRSEAEVKGLALAAALAAARHLPDVIVLACNTGSVSALTALREEFEPEIPVVGTVPAIKPAAAAGRPFAVWSTPTTTASSYQRSLIEAFAGGIRVAEVPCAGLADAIETGDLDLVRSRMAPLAEETPDWCAGLVLGSTHYPLAADLIRAALPRCSLFDSSEAVARQALKRGRALVRRRSETRPGRPLTVLLSGREDALPGAARAYRQGRLLAGLDLSA